MKDIPESEFCLELTPKELEELKGGYTSLIRKYPGGLPNGIVIIDPIVPVTNKPTGGGLPNGIVNPNLLS